MRKTRFFSLLLMIAMLLTPVVAAFANDGEASAIPAAWDGTVADGFASGTGTESDPYIIKTAGQLAYMRDQINAGAAGFSSAHYRLDADIALNDISNAANWESSAPVNAWEAIGNKEENAFTGTFDGNGHTIYGLYNKQVANGGKEGTYFYDGSEDTSVATAPLLTPYVGLFGRIEGATVKDVVLSDGFMKGLVLAGGLAAFANNSHISGIVNKSVSLKTDKDQWVKFNDMPCEAGGIVAELRGASIVTDCVNSAYIQGKNGSGSSGTSLDARAGGIVGRINNTSDVGCYVYNCVNYGEIRSWGQHNWNGHAHAGGIAGEVKYANVSACINDSALIIAELNDANNANAFAGGIVGKVYASTVSSCLNLGDLVHATPKTAGAGAGGSIFAGGIAGCTEGAKVKIDGKWVTFHGKVQNCISTGKVQQSATTKIVENVQNAVLVSSANNYSKVDNNYYIVVEGNEKLVTLQTTTDVTIANNYVITAEHLAGTSSDIIAADSAYANTANLVLALNQYVLAANAPNTMTFAQGEAHPVLYNKYATRNNATIAVSDTNGGAYVLTNAPKPVFPVGLGLPEGYGEGEVFSFTVSVNDGYILHGVNMICGENTVELLPDAEGIYTFAMPAEAVEVNIEIVQVSSDKFTVTFLGMNGEILKAEEVSQFGTATAPEAPAVEGYTFIGWDVAFDNVIGDLTVTAIYEINKYTVTFIGYGGAELKAEVVEHGQGATAPEAPIVEGFRFDGWDVAFTAVESDLTVKAIYVKTWTVTYLDIHGDAWKVEVYDEGSTPVMPEGPAVLGFTFERWNPEVINALTEDVVVSSVYSVDASASAESYKVMAWSYGGHMDFRNSYGEYGDFSTTLKQAVSEVNPDIIILDGFSSTDFLNQIAIDGYTCWAYGVHRGNNATDSDPHIPTSLGYGRAILYKTDKFTQAGTPQHDLMNGNIYSLKDGNRSYVIFPLRSNQSNAIIDVVNAWAYNNTEDQLQEMITAITAAIGTSAEQSLIHLRIASSTDIGLAYNGKFNTEADANGYTVTNYGGIVTKKDGDHADTHASNYYYSYMLSYAKGSVGVKDYAVVSATEDTAKYVNKNGSNGAWYTKAFALNFEMGSVEEVAEQFDAASVTLQDNLLVNFKVDAEKLAGKSLLKAIVTFGGQTYEITAGEAVDGQYIFSVPVAPHQMNDQIEIQLVFAHDLAGEWGGILTRYSVATYCYNKLNAESSSDELKALLVDILNYGAAAQVAVGYNTDNLANANLSDEQKAIGDVTADASSAQTEGMEAPEALWVSAGLLLNDKVVIRFAFEAENAEGLSVKVVLNGNEYTVSRFVPVAGAENRYYVYIEGLNATQLRDIVSVTVMRGEDAVSETLTYSVEVYATKVFAYAEVEGYENLVNLVKAMMAYGDSAEAYVASENQ